ncbi:SIR2 family protein [Deinococcus sp. 6GRE01]|uniref:SIR2 family protein n=1 Tax=Deinococcus sp. 6GRE01 TaxID=2745873 RepID=UPI001E371A2E|nr:SIR2 family protein [Deinococcus sp. 6GRE01]MCD0156321.1 SIR2 family protein [Deinococcus sp. 6GRE01]
MKLYQVIWQFLLEQASQWLQGGVSWSVLLKDAAEELGLEIERESDLVSLAQFYVNHNNQNKGALAQSIYDQLNLRDALPNKNHMALARMPIEKYWTTNFDHLIEKALTAEGKSHQAVYEPKQFFTPSRRANATVYKMHGDINHPSDVVITRADFERYHSTHEQFLNALTGDLTTKTMLFLGLSFTDPNLFYVLSRLKTRFDKSGRPHYAIMKNFSESDFEDTKDFEYATLRQNLFVSDLRRYDIITLMVNSHDEITEVLEEIDYLYRKRTIFISGSAHEYEPLGQVGTSNLLETIIEDQFTNGRRLISGYGLGLGDMIVGAAVRKFNSINSRSLDDRLLVRPFPQTFANEAERKKTWTDYRNDMISRSGIALFILGNKLSNGSTILADGVMEEFEIAKSKRLTIVPVGSTGYAAKEIWDEVSKNFDTFYPKSTEDLRKAFDDLNLEGDPVEIAKRVNKFIGMLSSRVD